MAEAPGAATAPFTSAQPPVTALILPAAREQIRREVSELGGDEIFFIARLDTDLMVEEVEAYAFGNRHAVPAIMQYARPGDVVIHNHPSGRLDPSDADIAVASELGSRAVGSYIIDNECTAVRVVVRPFRQAGVKPIKLDALANWLEPGGRVAENLEGYERRGQQIDMLRAVGEAFNHDGLAVIEAGTGTGKSMAYLLPAICWAIENAEKVVVSTGTHNLQEQLIDKDLPLLARATGLKFESTLMKGRNNYLCQRKADYVKHNPELLEDGKRQQLDEIQGWIRSTKTGDRGDLPFVPDEDVWEKVMSEADNCLRARCPFYDRCFFYNARRQAARAQVLVVNHHLLMADLALRAETNNYSNSAVLPPFHRIIIDEAHNLEDVATAYFGSRASRAALEYALRRLINRKGEGLLQHLAHKIHTKLYNLPPTESDTLVERLTRQMPVEHMMLQGAMEEAVFAVADRLDQDSDTPLHQPLDVARRIRDEELESPQWNDILVEPLRRVLSAARPYMESLDDVVRKLGPFLDDATPEQASPVLELRSAKNRIENVLIRLARFLGDADGRCRWIEYRRRPNGRQPDVFYCLAPLEVAPQLREQVLRRYKTVVMTSATLAVDRRFDYFKRQIGADEPLSLGLIGAGSTQPPAGTGDADMVAESTAADAYGREADTPDESEPAPPAPRHLRTLLLDTPFDYQRQVYLGVPMDLPEPNEAAFEPSLAALLDRSLRISHGRAMVLFTAYRLLDRVYERVAPGLETDGYPCLRQGQASRTALAEALRQGLGSVLFATASFWEGVDIPGEALSCLVLTRLPFRVPGEPLAEARIEMMRRQGRDPFHELIVPQAVIKFRQGFGRLIRTRRDRGAVIICDRRLMTRNYGRMFLNSLPTPVSQCGPAREVLAGLRDFFDGIGAEETDADEAWL